MTRCARRGAGSGGQVAFWRRCAVTFTLAVVLPILPARAVQPDEILPNAALEQRARAISGELRCLVCQNQSIDDSDAPLARDLRLLVRSRLTAGDSDEAVREYLVARYGDFVLLRPPVRMRTLLLWFGPLAIVAAGAAGILLTRRDRRLVEPAPLTAEETERLRAEIDRDVA